MLPWYIKFENVFHLILSLAKSCFPWNEQYLIYLRHAGTNSYSSFDFRIEISNNRLFDTLGTLGLIKNKFTTRYID